jgi:hypothetical protein
VRKINREMKGLVGPIKAMDNKTWAKFECETVDYAMLIVKVTPNGRRIVK